MPSVSGESYFDGFCTTPYNRESIDSNFSMENVPGNKKKIIKKIIKKKWRLLSVRRFQVFSNYRGHRITNTYIYNSVCVVCRFSPQQHPRTTMVHRSSPVNTQRFFCADVQFCMSKMYTSLFSLSIVLVLVCQAGGRTFEGIPGFGRNLIVRSFPPVPDFQSNLYEVYMEPLLFVRI